MNRPGERARTVLGTALLVALAEGAVLIPRDPVPLGFLDGESRFAGRSGVPHACGDPMLQGRGAERAGGIDHVRAWRHQAVVICTRDGFAAQDVCRTVRSIRLYEPDGQRFPNIGPSS